MVAIRRLARNRATVRGRSTTSLRRLRLGEARRRMIVLGDTAAQAAVAVVYRSASHFSRDYRALHGRPPAADACRARELLARGEVAIA